jgi:hypothetical protein
MKRIFIAIIILASILTVTCDVALGSKINLAGPVVEILGPVSNTGKSDPEVGTLFTLYGTAESNSVIARMNVTLTYFNRAANKMVTMGREWQWEGTWQIRESSSQSWRRYTPDLYAADSGEYPVSDPSWVVSDKIVNWKLPIYMNRMEKGQFFVSVTAWDSAENSDSNSSKRLKVEFSNESPTLKIEIPVMMDGEGSLAEPKPPDYSGAGYIYDPFGNPRQTYDNLKNFTNKFMDLRWTAEHKASLTALTLEIANEHNLDINDPRKKVYYRGEFNNLETIFTDTSTTHRGNHTDPGALYSINDRGYTKIGGMIKLGEGVYADNFNALPKDRITPLQIVSTLVDVVSKREYKSKGWFLWLPDSDKPFADITFGHKVKEGAVPPPDAAERATAIIRGSTTNRVNFYDDKEGLAWAVWSLHRLQDNSLEVDSTVVLNRMINLDQRTNTSWNFEAEYGYGVGRYKIVVQAKDYGTNGTDGILGDEYTAYFTIVSNSAPEILDWPSALALPDGGPAASTVWGNPSGNITLSGRAAIECSETCNGNDHSVRVNRVTIVLLNYDNGDIAGSQNSIRFTDPSYTGWNSGTNAGSTDSYGNKIWEIPLADITIIGSTVGNNGNGHREEWNFTKTLNWFTDLKGNVTTGNKNFIVRALTKPLENNDKEFYGIKTLTVRGDDTQPEAKITRLEIQKNDNGWKNDDVYVFGTDNRTLQAITKNHRVRLVGTWSDDSAGSWTVGTMFANPRNYFRSLKVQWAGNQKQYDLNIVSFVKNTTNGGTWETDWFEGFPDEGNTDPVINLKTDFRDLAGNVGEDNKEVLVETDMPTLARISSEMSNGRYGPNKDTNGTGGHYIDIFLGFNKPIYYGTGSPTFNSTLYLNLNNGARAIYATGFGNDRIVFRYTLTAGDNNTDRLNVTSINFGDFPKENWHNLDGIPALFPDLVFAQGNSMSLSGQKNIIIDKSAPTVDKISTSAASKTYGKGQQIVITVEFNKEIDVVDSLATGSTSPLFLSLAGGNLVGNGAKAYYSNKAGSRSIQFVYNIANGDDTQTSVISVSGLSGGVNVKDKAENLLAASPAIPGGGALDKSIWVKTTNINQPNISATIAAGRTAYGPVIVTIGNIVSGSRVEHHTDYVSDMATTTGWINHGTQGATSRDVTVSSNGVYNFAARQFDTATPENQSPTSGSYGFTVDNGAVLTKITSSNSSGIYGFDSAGIKNKINIELEFRIPVTVSGSLSDAYLVLNTGNQVPFTTITGAQTGTKKLTLVYTIPDGTITPAGQYLDVNSIYYGPAINIVDGTGTDLKTYITVGGVAADNRLNKQKEITVITGRPSLLNGNAAIGTASTGTQSTWFNGTQLGIKFDREISRGITAGKLIIRQIAGNGNYRIPALLTEKQWNDIFSGRDAMFTEHSSILSGITVVNTAAKWRALGEYLYEKGSNGATRGTGTGGPLTPDTSTKYVLRFSVEPAAADGINYAVPGLGTVTMGNLRILFRAAEALSFDVNDPNVSITGQNLTVQLTGERALPVKGASYEFLFPNGFVIDVLNKPNNPVNDLYTGIDTTISSGETTRLLAFTGVQTEMPVIRIDKGDDNVYFNDARNDDTLSTATRQARQKLQTTVKIDCRTPGATIRYWNRFVSDNALVLLMRNNPGNVPNNLPNLGNGNTKADWENVRMRPQSGVNGMSTTSPITGVNWTGLGINNYVPVINQNWPAATGGDTQYNGILTIGAANYSDGGQEYNFRAWASSTGNTNSDVVYETAYRSVLLFSNYNLNGNANVAEAALGGAANRLWVRGSNTTQGDPTIPDFPISRQVNLWRKVKLMTPITPPVGTTAATNLGDAQIPANQDADGRHLWFWVTWRINVPAFVDVHIGKLPVGAELTDGYTNGITGGTGGIHAPFGNTIQKFFMSYIPHVEHYAVHPGRTTIMEARAAGAYNNQWDGQHGGLNKTNAAPPIGPPID